MDVLLEEGDVLLRNRRFGLVAHPASVDVEGCPSAVRLRARWGGGLASLFSPEHGLYGIAGAGEKVASVRHPTWGIPVHSLYGRTRRPTPAMLADLDAVIFDLQDLSIRCYTYVSTLRYLLEAAASCRVKVIVTDRGNPLAGIVDGPMLDPKFESFVGCLPGPLVYGLTSGEAARWLCRVLKLKVDLEVVPMQGFQPAAAASGHRWISPSPSIRNPHSAWCYPVTVGFEAWPAVDHGRRTPMPFELVGMPGLDADALAERLNDQGLPGMLFHPAIYENGGRIFGGARIAVTNPLVYRPVAASVAVLDVLGKMTGGKCWRARGSRPAFFDQLFGTDSVRRALQAGVSWRKIAAGWKTASWRRRTRAILLHARRT